MTETIKDDLYFFAPVETIVRKETEKFGNRKFKGKHGRQNLLRPSTVQVFDAHRQATSLLCIYTINEKNKRHTKNVRRTGMQFTSME